MINIFLTNLKIKNKKNITKIHFILKCNRYEVTLYGCVQNSKLKTVLINRVNTLGRIRQVDEPTPIKTEEEIISIICQIFRELGMDITHIDYGEDIVYSIGTYISQITYYITTRSNIVE